MSGIPRVGLPAGWNWVPLDSLAEVLVSTIDKKSQDSETPVRLCNYTDVYYNDAITDNIEFMQATASADQISRFTVTAGDVPITKDSEASDDIGRPSYVPKSLPGVVYGYHLAIYRPRDPSIGPFIRYLFEESRTRGELEMRTPGVTRVGLSRDTLRNLHVPYPGACAARAIADYLDHETAEIDALIGDFTEVYTTLEERWKSERDHLLWNKPDSTGLKLAPLKHFFTITLGKMLDERKHDLASQQFPYIRAGNIADGGIDYTDMKQMPFVTAEKIKYNLLAGDILVVEGGSIGTNAILTEDLPGIYFQKTVLRLRPKVTMHPRVVSESLNSLRDNGALTLETGRSTIAHLPAEKLAELRVPHLPYAEQKEIGRRLEESRAQTEVLQADLTRAITLAKERRAALITAAVTGQIDVTAKHRPAAEQLEDDIKELT